MIAILSRRHAALVFRHLRVGQQLSRRDVAAREANRTKEKS